LKKPERVSFNVAHTRLVLEPVQSGAKPAIARVSVKIAGFDTWAVADKLKKLNVEAMPVPGEKALRFNDPKGFTIELTAGV